MSIALDTAREADLPGLARIAAENFQTARNYEGLESRVVARFAECNSVERLRTKLYSGRHLFVVARDPASQEPVGFAVAKKLSDRCLLATRMHVRRGYASHRLGREMQRYILGHMRRGGYDLLYAEASGEAHAGFCRAGRFLYVDSFANAAIRNARIDRVVIDAHAGTGTAAAESGFLPLLSGPSLYARFLDTYGLVVERLYRKIERMHHGGASGVSQSVFDHVLHGLSLLKALRENLDSRTSAAIDWTAVEAMWIFHDVGEIGLDADIPSYKKTRLQSAAERTRAAKILGSIQPRELRMPLEALHDRYERRKTAAASTPATVDTEAAICAFVDKLEAATFIGTSGIARVWKSRTGRWLLQHVLRRNALGAFLEPARELALVLDERGRGYLRERLAGVVTAYHAQDVISSAFHQERLDAIDAAVGWR